MRKRKRLSREELQDCRQAAHEALESTSRVLCERVGELRALQTKLLKESSDGEFFTLLDEAERELVACAVGFAIAAQQHHYVDEAERRADETEGN